MLAQKSLLFYEKIVVKILLLLINHQVAGSDFSFEELSKDCGLSYSDRIVGGENATLGQYPWLARLGYNRA
jgi:hypothetical protein